MSDYRDPNDANLSGTVIKALDVLECLAEYRRSMSVQEIARACGMSRPTTYRLLTTLMSRGFVRVDDNYHYSLGTKLLSFGSIVLDSIDLPELARPYLRELCVISNETAYLSILDGTEIVYVGKEESLRTSQTPISVQMRSSVGMRLPPHCCAMGKSIIAHLPPGECQTLLERIKPLKSFTRLTITDPAALLRELERIRQQAYAVDDREVDDGTSCVGAPIFDSTGRAIAAISIAGPAYRLTLDHLHELSKDVIRVTQALSHQLGYTG